MEDNGIGIAENELNKVLEPFHQETTGYTRDTTGTGLGLSIVADIAGMNGGSLTLDESPMGSLLLVALALATIVFLIRQKGSEVAESSRSDQKGETTVL